MIPVEPVTSAAAESPRPPSQTRSVCAPRLAGRSLRNLLIFLACNIFVLNGLLLLIDRTLLDGDTWQADTFHTTAMFFEGRQGTDSLGAMLPAIHLLEQNPRTRVYQSIFFDDHVKFQYPLTSLLPYYALQRIGVSDRSLFRLTKIATYVSVGLTVLLTILISRKARLKTPNSPHSRLENLLLTAAICAASLFFYPLMRGFVLGQIQAILTFGFTLAFYCWIEGKEIPAGIVMGLMVLVKPQYGLFFIWALIRKKFGAAIAGLACTATGVLVSCIAFGFGNNLQYLQVLRSISASGESYYANQSANGLLNRLLFNGPNLFWDANHFAPHNTTVYLGTLITTLALLILALIFPGPRERRGGVADFACIVLASTMASPVAWEHHYGILLPILAWLWFAIYAGRDTSQAKIAMATAWVLASNSIPPVTALASVPIVNVFESYLYLGGLLVLILLLGSGSRHAWNSGSALA
jgi:alpha-1,2-mannosyltransferase